MPIDLDMETNLPHITTALELSRALRTLGSNEYGDNNIRFTVDRVNIAGITWDEFYVTALAGKTLALARRIFEAIEIFSFAKDGYTFVPDYLSASSQYITIDGKVFKNGRIVGEWSRCLNYTQKSHRPRYVDHHSFSLNERHQKHGIGRAWIQHCFSKYRQHGFSNVEVEAAGDNGRYTWATMGFEIERHEPDGNPHLWSSYYNEHKALKIIERARKRGTDPETIKIAEKLVEDGIPRSVKMAAIAKLGKGGPWKDRRGHHLGKALLLIGNEWNGRYNLKAKSVAA